MGASDRPTRAAAAAMTSSGGGSSAETRGASVTTAKRSVRSRKAPAVAATMSAAMRDELAANEDETKQQALSQQLQTDALLSTHAKHERQPIAGAVSKDATGQSDETSTTAVTVVEDTDVMKPSRSLPACLNVRVAPSPPTIINDHRVDHDEHDEHDDAMGDLDDTTEAALRIDAATSAGSGAQPTTSPTSVTSAPTSPADDSGLNTPNSTEILGAAGTAAAAKRRRLEDPPLFLEKTYEMLEKCAPEIAGWSVPAGDSFVVKKPIEFADRVIPVYFKHRNFSSFVRQLNFYGFRKVRVETSATTTIDPKEWWEFRHDKFVRGRRDLLREIKRRTIADGRSTIERAEMDDLRAEVVALKDQVQQLNANMARVLEALAVKSSGGNNSSAATTSPTMSGHYQTATAQSQSMHLPSMMHHSQAAQRTHQQQQQHLHHHALASPAQVTTARAPLIPSAIAKSSSFPHQQQQQQQSIDTPLRSPVTTYQLRPLQSVVSSVHHVPQGATTATTAGNHLSPVFTYRSGPGSAPAGMSFVDRVEWSRHVPPQHHAPQQQHTYDPQSRFAAAAFANNQDRAGAIARPTTAPLRRPEMPTQHAVAGYKRTHDDYSDSSSALRETLPDAAVRQLSRTAAQTRGELLSCIISRILGFIRVQQQQQPRTSEVISVASCVASDIQQLLARVQEPPSSPAGTAHTGNSEAACMYRVEILKFISRELPRAVQEAVEKRIPQPLKKHVNRSLLALLVQKAQAALEHQMRLETTPLSVAAAAAPAATSSGALMHS